MIFTGLHELFSHKLRLLFLVQFLMFPCVQLKYGVLLHLAYIQKEKRAFLPFLLATPVLFLLGAVTVARRYSNRLGIFVSFEQIGGQGTLPMELEPKVNEYLSLVMGLILAFGICFELPIFLLLATKVGITNAEGLKKKGNTLSYLRLFLATIVTPPDVISQVLLAVPIIILYELSIFFARHIEPELEETDALD